MSNFTPSTLYMGERILFEGAFWRRVPGGYIVTEQRRTEEGIDIPVGTCFVPDELQAIGERVEPTIELRIPSRINEPEGRMLELLKLAQSMREAQRAYFKDRRSDLLTHSKVKEREFDKALEEYFNPQTPKLDF